MDHWSAGEVAGYSAAGVGVLGLFGSAIKWMVTWLSGRNDKHVADLIAETKALRRKLDGLDAKLMFLGAEIAVLLSSVQDPSARDRASAALRRVFPVDQSTPPDMTALARDLDRGSE